MDSSQKSPVSRGDAREVTREKLETVLKSFHKTRNPDVDPVLEVSAGLSMNCFYIFFLVFGSKKVVSRVDTVQVSLKKRPMEEYL